MQTLDDTIQQEALSQARANIEAEVQQLAAVIAARSTARLKYQLRLPMNNQEARELMTPDEAPAPLVINVKAKEPNARPSWWQRTFKKHPPSPIAKPVATYQQTTMDARADELEAKQPKSIYDAVKMGVKDAGAPDNYGPEWQNSTDITTTLDAYAWVCLNCEGSNPPHTSNCQYCGQPRTNGSPVTAFAGLPPTYHPVDMTPKPETRLCPYCKAAHGIEGQECNNCHSIIPFKEAPRAAENPFPDSGKNSNSG